MLSASDDVDWHRFQLDSFATVDIQTASYPLLGKVKVELVPDDPDSRAAAELIVTTSPGLIQMTALIAPGVYRLRVSGGLNLYELTATITPRPTHPWT